MNIPSKDAPPKETISTIKAILSKLDIELEENSLKHPLPNCFSLNLSYKKASNYIFSNGKGGFEEAALASAYGEFIERLQTKNFFNDFYIADYKHFRDEVVFEFGGEYLNDELFSIYDKNDELSYEDLVDFNSSYSDKIVAIAFKDLQNNTTYFPINIVQNLYASNGLASGNSPNEAKSQALCEIFERFVKFEVIKNGYALPTIETKSYTKIDYDMQRLRKYGFIVEAYDASLNGLYPVCAISLIDPKKHTCFVSFGSSPNVEIALQRSLNELMQGRDIELLDGFYSPSLDMEIVSSYTNLESHFIDSNGIVPLSFFNSNKSFQATLWSYDGTSSSDDFRFLLKCLGDKKLYIREYNYLGFYTTQLIVPNFSEVYPIDDLLYNNKNRAKKLRDMLLNYNSYDTDDLFGEIEDLDDNLDVGKYIGVIFKQNFKICDIKAWLYMLSSDLQDAIYQLEESNLEVAKLLKELLFAKLNRIEVDDIAITMFYSNELYTKAKDILKLKEKLFDTTFSDEYLDILSLYGKLNEL